MKKLLILIAIITLFLSSCSSDSNENNQGNVVKKMIIKGETVSWDLKNYNFNFIYDNEDRLIRINREDKVYREFVYSGDLIVQIKYYVFWNLEPEPTLYSITNFEYDTFGRLIKAKTNSEYEYYFNYTDENHIDFEIKIYTWPGTNNLYSTGTVNLDTNTYNILSTTQTFYQNYLNDDGLPQPSSTFSGGLIYDDKKHPCSGIKGYKQLALFNFFSFDNDFFIAGFGATNNLIASEQYWAGQPNVVNTLWSHEYSGIFPSKAKKENSGDFKIYFYY